jgi:hypothetical protein
VFPALRASAGRAAASGLLILLVFASSCRPSRLQVLPVPPDVRTLEGYGTVKLVRDGESGRSRFSFVIEAGRRAKVEVLDAFNRSAAEIFLAPDEAYFVLRSEKAYWKAAPEDVVERFLGVRLGLDEVTGLLCGRRPGGPEGFDFRVRETFPGGSAPRRVEFAGSGSEGTITVLALSFNAPVVESVFALDFLATHAALTWTEMERILRRED